MFTEFVPLPGSVRHPMRRATLLGPAHPEERLELTLRLRPRAPLPAQLLDGEGSHHSRCHLTHDQLEERHGADLADMAKVEAFARAAGLAW